MFSRYRRILGEIRRSYPPEKARAEARGEFLAYILFRPVSFYVTPFLILAGFTANGVTALGMVVAGLLPLAAGFGGAHAYAWVAGLLLVHQVLDCADGNVARTSGRPTILGAMLDGVGTLLSWTCYMIAVGLLAGPGATNWIGRHGAAVGLGVALAFVLQRQLEDTYSHYFGESVPLAPSLPVAPAGTAAGPRFSLGDFAKLFEQPVAIGGVLVAGAGGWMEYFLAGLAVYQCGAVLLWLPRFIRSIRRRAGQPDARDPR